VHAGGGTATDMLSVFVPQLIQVGIIPHQPHTATFVFDRKTATDIVSPFAESNSTQLTAIPPNSNNEPLNPPGKDNVVISMNVRSFIPTVIDSQGNVKHFAPNAAYTVFMLSGSKLTLFRPL
jgi:hypothetical protein